MKITEKLRSLFTAEETQTTTEKIPDNKLYRWFKSENSTAAFRIMAGVYVLIGVFGLLRGNTGGSFFFLAMAPWLLVLEAAVRSEKKNKRTKDENEKKEM